MKSVLIIADNMMQIVFEINYLQLVHVIYTLSDKIKLLKLRLVKEIGHLKKSAKGIQFSMLSMNCC